MRYGIQTLSPQHFNGPPDIAVAGFNVGANLGRTVLVSGTVGAATEAVKEGIPAIAFSGTTGSQTAWDADVETYETVYADLSTNVTQAIVASGKPFLPDGIWLNVNYPAVSAGSCESPSDYGFVLSRINTAGSGNDVVTCNNGGQYVVSKLLAALLERKTADVQDRLPDETSVVKSGGCYASISVGVATTKADATTASQQVVLDKLSSILSCLPSSSS